MKSILVFCGSAAGNDPLIVEQTKQLGVLFAQKNIRLIYGAGNMGLMGTLADHVLNNGGQAVGVIPEFMIPKELAHKGLNELYVVKTMHERKQKMAELSDAVITLPGGIGTMEELFEFFTWLQLQLHHKPIGILNVNGYYDFLLQQLNEMVKRKFLLQANLDQLIIENKPEKLLNLLLEKSKVEEIKDFYDQVKKLG